MVKVLNIIGNGGHSKVVVDIAELMNSNYRETKLIDYNYIQDFLQTYNEGVQSDVFIAIGTNFKRQDFYVSLASKFSQINFPNFIHPTSFVSKYVEIGFGNFIGANSYIGPNTKIGNFTIINSGSIVEHDSNLLDFSSIGPGCELGGNVKIGLRSAVGIGCTVLQKINISDDSIIGAKSLLNIDCPNNVVMYGIPAKIIRKRNNDDEYLNWRRGLVDK